MNQYHFSQQHGGGHQWRDDKLVSFQQISQPEIERERDRRERSSMRNNKPPTDRF